MTDHGEITVLWIAPMDVSLASPHDAEGRTKISPDGLNDRLAKSNASGGVTDEWCEDIPFAKAVPARGTQGLLASTQKNAAMNFSSPV